jgi:hypothetical protein
VCPVLRVLLAGLALLGLGVACGGEEPPPARYDVFTVALVGLAEGERVHPGQPLTFRIDYQGDLARGLAFTALFTHEASGASEYFRWSEPPADSARFTFARQWFLRHDFLRRPGRIRVQIQASLTATRNGSTPWVATSQSVYVETFPRLDRVTLRLPAPGQPVPYGTPIDFEVAGADLWAPVTLTVADAQSGASVAGLEQTLPFDGSQDALASTWTLRAAQWERVGTHALRLVARYGELEALSEPFAFEVTHTLDTVTLLLRDPTGRLAPSPGGTRRLDEVRELVLRVSGTRLAGHTLSVNGGPPVVATGDSMELSLLAPRSDDFEDGEGVRRYDFLVRSGGMEREVGVSLQRWGIAGCGWYSAEGRPLEEGETLESGTEVLVQAQLWGFPDTTTRWLFFESPLAHFTLWERDSGRDPYDLFANHDDEVETLEARVQGGQTQARWGTRFDEEVEVLDLNRAEYYFELRVEDQLCTSGDIRVLPLFP